MSEVYYEVHLTRVLLTVRIRNVDGAMSVDRNKRDGKFRAQYRPLPIIIITIIIVIIFILVIINITVVIIRLFI